MTWKISWKTWPDPGEGVIADRLDRDGAESAASVLGGDQVGGLERVACSVGIRDGFPFQRVREENK